MDVKNCSGSMDVVWESEFSLGKSVISWFLTICGHFYHDEYSIEDFVYYHRSLFGMKTNSTRADKSDI